MKRSGVIMGAVTQFLVRNAPKILTGIAVGGTVVTAVLAAKETMIAQEVVDAYKTENPDATKKDIFKKAAPVYLPSVISGVATIGCIIGAQVLNGNHIALLEGACSTASIVATERHKALESVLGAAKSKEVREAEALEKARTTQFKESEVFCTGDGTALFMEPWTRRFFRSCYNAIEKAKFDTLEEIKGRSEVTMNDFFFNLHIPPADAGKPFGWNEEHPIDFHILYDSDDFGEPCGIIVYDEPMGFYQNGTLGWRKLT